MEIVRKGSIMKIAIPLSCSKTQHYVNMAYTDLIISAGFVPVMVPQGADVTKFMAEVDGLLLPGGIDVDPIHYGDDNWASMTTDPSKDAFERELLYAAMNNSVPVFGICRGFQLIIREYMLSRPNILDFMAFEQHVDRHNQVENQQLPRTIHQHFVNYVPGLLYSSENADEYIVNVMPVNSMHHQCLTVDFGKGDTLGVPGFDMIAWTQRGLKITVANKHEVVCEAYRINDWAVPILAVQWHPEELRDTKLLSNFFRPKGKQIAQEAV